MTGIGEHVHILIVDDDRLVLSSIARGLRKAGYDVSEAHDVASARQVVATSKIALAMLDVRMPETSGVKFAQELASQHVPFLFLSAYDDEDVIREATKLGALAYLVKPLDVAQILPSIEAALARAEQIRSLEQTGAQLGHALESGREISVAVGILMERLRVTHDSALDILRANARSQRRRMHEVAIAMIEAIDTINRLDSHR
jgi:AmiR/NasT family two-component response regulator